MFTVVIFRFQIDVNSRVAARGEVVVLVRHARRQSRYGAAGGSYVNCEDEDRPL